VLQFRVFEDQFVVLLSLHGSSTGLRDSVIRRPSQRQQRRTSGSESCPEGN